MSKTAAAKALRLRMRSLGISNAEAARQLGVTPVALHYWLRGIQRPRAEMREVIERWSGGAVQAADWLKESERARIDGTEEAHPSPETPTDPGKAA